MSKSKRNHVDPATSSGSSPTLRSRHALRVIDAAEYLSLAPFFVEELLRTGEITFREPSYVNGDGVVVRSKYRLIDADDLDAYLARQPKQRITKITNGKIFTEKAA